MSSKNTTNFKFLKDFKPELYKLAVKMEEDFLLVPASMLAYATRFLEYILYDIARDNGHEVNRETGFVNNIYELIQLDYLEYYLGDLLIKAYHFRNTSIHNVNITQSLKEDRKTAFELNKRLFDIADIYYKNLTNDYEPHQYVEPAPIDESKDDVHYIIKQAKAFDNCIICGESTKYSKSNFCQDCDKLLNYRDVLARIVASKGTDVLLKREDIHYPFRDQLIRDLLDLEVFRRIGNDLKIMPNELDKLFILTDKFMEVDRFLANFIKSPKGFKPDFPREYPYLEIPDIVRDHYVVHIINLCEHGFLYKTALKHVDVDKSDLNRWYDNKKSDFIDGNKDDLFIRYNEILIEDLFKSLKKHKVPSAREVEVEFWMEHFDGFAQRLSGLSTIQIRLLLQLFKTDSSKDDILNRLDIPTEEMEGPIENPSADMKSSEEIERRKRLMLVCIDDNLNFTEAIERSKLDIEEIEKSKNNFLSGESDEFYDKLSGKLMKKYLNLRRIGNTTDEICERLAIDRSEVELWISNDSFEDFQHSYIKIRLAIFKSEFEKQKGMREILHSLEMDDDEFKNFICMIEEGEKYPKFRDFVLEEYYPGMIRLFLDEFREKLNVNVALNELNLTRDVLEKYLYQNEELYSQFIDIKINKIVSTFIRKGKVNNNLLKKLDLSKEEYSQYEDTINERIVERQLPFIIRELEAGEISLTICKKINCDVNQFFHWILRGSTGDDKFEQLAEVYWREHVGFISHINREIIIREMETVSRNKLISSQLKYDFDHWMKWGLIDRENTKLTVDDVKEKLAQYV